MCELLAFLIFLLCGCSHSASSEFGSICCAQGLLSQELLLPLFVPSLMASGSNTLDTPLLSDSDSPLEPMGTDGEFRLFRIKLKSPNDSVKVFYGHKDDDERPPTIVMGISKTEAPQLALSTAFSRDWPGRDLQGCECHFSGDTIGWVDTKPLNFKPWLAKSTYPGCSFLFQIHKNHLHVLQREHMGVKNRLLHRFLQPVWDDQPKSAVWQAKKKKSKK